MREEYLLDLIAEIKEIGSKIEQIVSIVLVGSVARNEYLVSENNIRSDFEIVIFVSATSKEISRSIQTTISDLSLRYEIKVEASIVRASKVRKYSSRLFYQDMKRHGRNIYGRDISRDIELKAASELDLFDVNNIVFYRALSIYSSSSDDYARRLLKNASYLYLYALLEQGFIGTDFRSRFDEIERISRGGLYTKGSLFSKFFGTLGDEFDVVKSYRLSEFSGSLSASVMSSLQHQMLMAIDHCQIREKFSIIPNLRMLRRIVEDSVRYPEKAIDNMRLISFQPRAKLLKSLHEVLRENIENRNFAINEVQRKLFYNCYEGNYL